MRIATWNTEWRKPTSSDAAVIRERLAAFSPDLVCLTETHVDFLAEWGGHSIYSTDDWGGPTHGTRRETLLWSKNPWRHVDALGSSTLPPGRFIRAVTDTPLGEAEVIGIVIPYHMSNVRTGARNRQLWELHRQCLDALPAITATLGPASIVLGDFNQRIPSKWVPRELREKLIQAMGGLNIVTDGIMEPIGRAAIDHIAIGPAFRSKDVLSISNQNGDKLISDHFGVTVSLAPGKS